MRPSPDHRWVVYGLPLGLFGAIASLAGLSMKQPGGRSPTGALQVAAAGLVGPEIAGRNGDYAAIHPSRQSPTGERELSIRVPSINRLEEDPLEPEVITVSKSGANHEVDFEASRREWRYLSKAVRSLIDEAGIRPGRWNSIVVHNSATLEGGSRVLGYHHRHIRNLPEGLAYHFVIGNGSYSRLGEIEVGERWARQSEGEPLLEPTRNDGVIGICLVGDFNENAVEVAQLEAFDELTDYLQARVGVMEIKTHADAVDGKMKCPGRFFPARLLKGEQLGPEGDSPPAG